MLERVTQRTPVIGITMGDAAGIGPEVVLKALATREYRDKYRAVIIGDRSHLQRQVKRLGLDISLEENVSGSAVEVFDLDNLPADSPVGIDDAVTGRASAEYIEAAVRLWKQGQIEAIATAPISKKAIAMGGYDFPGHTEFLASLTETSDFAMSFFAGKLRVVLLSTHLPLRAALDMVKREALVDLISFTSRELSRLLGRGINIAVAGLNPHASEHGMFGSEEADEIEPAIAECRGDGINVTGPYSPDTIFARCHQGDFDAVIALYHDQATIAVKSLAFGSAVNVTLGLPLIRTSVDHGTAYDIAGKGVADPSSMAAAIDLAADLARSKTLGSRARI